MENAEEKLGKLLEEFKGLRDDLSRVMLLFDSRIAKCERKLDREAQEREKADAEMSEKFERLVEKVNELAQNPVWRSKDSQRVALDRNETYEWCDRIGLPHTDALTNSTRAECLYGVRKAETRFPSGTGTAAVKEW